VRSASNSHVIDTNQLHNELVEHQPNTQQPILLEPAMPRMFEDKVFMFNGFPSLLSVRIAFASLSPEEETFGNVQLHSCKK
jgi:hypothetical protein